MPIVSEKSEGSRKTPRALLVGCSAVVFLLLLLPLVPLACPVTLHVGDRWLYVETFWGRWKGSGQIFTGSMRLGPRGIPAVFSFRATHLLPVFTPEAPSRIYWLRIGRFCYVVQPFRGHRGYP